MNQAAARSVHEGFPVSAKPAVEGKRRKAVSTIEKIIHTTAPKGPDPVIVIAIAVTSRFHDGLSQNGKHRVSQQIQPGLFTEHSRSPRNTRQRGARTGHPSVTAAVFGGFLKLVFRFPDLPDVTYKIGTRLENCLAGLPAGRHGFLASRFPDTLESPDLAEGFGNPAANRRR